MTTAAKVQVVYSEPFWRSEGLSGQVLADLPPVPFAFDNSPPDASVGVLMVLTGSDLLPDDPKQRRRDVLDGLASFFGERALAPVDYVELLWEEDPWHSGCVSAVGPGILSGPGRVLREPVGRIHWAGTETAEKGNGYMEGAVRSGERVARELLALYGTPRAGIPST